MIRAILFDFNGILVDDEPLHMELFQRVLSEEGLTLTERDYYEKYLALDDRHCFHAVLTDAGEAAPEPRLHRLIARKASYYRDRIKEEGYPFFPGAVDLVRSVSEAGLTLGVVSGALRQEVVSALQQEDLLSLFKVLVTADDIPESKPDPAGYRNALESLNTRPPFPERLLHPHDVLAIEDSPAGIEAALGAGLMTLGVGQTYDVSRLNRAQKVVGSVAELDAESIQGLFP